MKLATTILVMAVVLSGTVSGQNAEIGKTPQDNSPHTSVLVSVNGITLHYLDWGGGGEVVLLLSGLGNDAHIFDEFAPKLTDRWHVVGLTRRGFGESSKPVTGHTTSIRVEDMRQFLEMLNIRKVHIIGHSLAGDEMTLFASRYPTQVGKLVYFDAAYDRSGSLEMGLTNPGISDVNRRLTLEALDSPEAARAPLPSGNMPTPDTLRIMVAYLKEMNDFRPEFSTVRAPVLALYALSDRYPTLPAQVDEQTRMKMNAWWVERLGVWQRARIQEFRRQQPNAEVIEMNDAPHFLFLGRTQDATLRYTREFLSR